MMKLVILAATVLLAAAVVAAADIPDQSEGDTSGKSVVGTEEDPGKLFLFAQRSITTVNSITTETTSVLSTCLQAIDAVACTGRKKRSLRLKREAIPVGIDGEKIDSSISESLEDLEKQLTDENADHSKFFFTVWATATSIITAFTTSTDTANVVSISAMCSNAALAGIPNCR